ncbi:ATP-binding protein [Deinococcus marmoris]|uniref:ATP-binding protein n=1 Tax=Deinococcus marmoris TaxID=249408 RepID=UPI0012DD5CF4|nr:ATP-binding protein [Deinococcus marmoris]
MELDTFMNLLLKPESEILDFKKEFHDNNVKLVHDILCLLNSYSEENRFLTFGVSDSKGLYGVAGDANRKNNANIQDLLRASRVNRFPDVIMHNIIHDGKEFDILEIKNRPDKPFFLLHDKAEKGKTLRAGVVYTRLGDTNTPLGESAPEDRIELMWRERFGIGMPPLDRVLRLLEDTEQWERPSENELHHRVFPEFLTDLTRQSFENSRIAASAFVIPRMKF